jgi:hypothetical protein
MDDFLTFEDNVINLNTVTLAGKVVSVEKISGKAVGLMFMVAYQKHWPSGNVQQIDIKCYTSGEARLEKLDWLKAGEWALVSGEATNRGNVYAYQIQQLSRPDTGDDLDAYFARMSENQAGRRQ